MARLVFVCEKQPDGPAGAAHDTDILMKRCVYCRQFGIAGYRCACGHEDCDRDSELFGHGPGECVDKR